jgi:hypothetical protein
MKISDILSEQIETKVTDHKTGLNLKVPHLNRHERDRVLGRGIANIVLNNKRDPHTVLRHNSNVINPHVDSSSPYYKWLVSTKAYDSNPYFPRIYARSTVKDKSGKTLITHEIEKLHSLDALEPEVLEGIYTALFDENAIERASSFAKKYSMNDKHFKKLILLNCLDWTFDGRVQTSDEQLQQALKKARELSFENEIGGPDMHEENVMVRLTPHGPQLVLTDPI